MPRRQPPPPANQLYIDALLKLAEAAAAFYPIATAREEGIQATYEGAPSRRWDDDHRVAAERLFDVLPAELYADAARGGVDPEYLLSYAGHRLIDLQKHLTDVYGEYLEGNDL